GSNLALLGTGGQSFSIPAASTAATTAGSAAPATSTTTTPASGGTSAAGAAGVATSVGTGPDKLVLNISQDAYQGDAQYTVSVDGKQVGGTLTAHAAHGA